MQLKYEQRPDKSCFKEGLTFQENVDELQYILLIVYSCTFCCSIFNSLISNVCN